MDGNLRCLGSAIVAGTSNTDPATKFAALATLSANNPAPTGCIVRTASRTTSAGSRSPMSTTSAGRSPRASSSAMLVAARSETGLYGAWAWMVTRGMADAHTRAGMMGGARCV